MARLAFETIGEVTSYLYYYLIALNIIPVVFVILNKYRGWMLGGIFLIGFLIIPYQLYLGSKLISLKEEGANIVAYLYQQMLKEGAYPEVLSEYQFNFPELKEHFTYSKGSHSRKEPAEAFRLNYYVGTPNTSHFYDSEVGKWGYYPD